MMDMEEDLKAMEDPGKFAERTAIRVMLDRYDGKEREDSLAHAMALAISNIPIGTASKAFIKNLSDVLGEELKLPLADEKAQKILAAFDAEDPRIVLLLTKKDAYFIRDKHAFITEMTTGVNSFGTHFSSYSVGVGDSLSTAATAISADMTGQEFLVSGPAPKNKFRVCGTRRYSGSEKSLLEEIIENSDDMGVAFIEAFRVFFPDATAEDLTPFIEKIRGIMAGKEQMTFSNPAGKTAPWKIPSVFLPWHDGADREAFIFTSHSAREANNDAFSLLFDEVSKSQKVKASMREVEQAIKDTLAITGHDLASMSPKDIKDLKEAAERRVLHEKLEESGAWTESRSILARILKRNGEDISAIAESRRAARAALVGFSINGKPQNAYSGAQSIVRMITTRPAPVARTSRLQGFLGAGTILHLKPSWAASGHIRTARSYHEKGWKKQADAELLKAAECVIREYVGLSRHQDDEAAIISALNNAVISNTLRTAVGADKWDKAFMNRVDANAALAVMKEKDKT